MKKTLLILFTIIHSILNAQIVQVKKLVANNAVTNGRFGSSVAIEGDIAVTGAYWDDNNSFTSAGAVYVHYRNQGGADQWGVIKKLIPSDPENGKEFGWIVDLENNILVVGALGDNNYQGAAYVFYKDQGGVDNWGQVAKLTHTQHSSSNGDELGVSVAIEGNIIAVGAHRYYTNATGSETGAVYIYEKDNGGIDNWGQIKKVMSGDPDDSELFGYCVDIEGDVMVIGAYHDKNTVDYGGAAYIFERNSGGTDNWGQIKKITESPALHDKFGYDVDLDGTTLAISSWWHTHSGKSRAGAVYVYDQNEGGTNNWGMQKKLTLASPNSSDWFGSSLALEGDKLLVGAERADLGSTTNGGGMYLFERNNGGVNNWGMIQEIKADDMANNDKFGRQVAMSGDYMISGSYQADHSSLTNAGASYIFGPAIPLNNQNIQLSGERLNSTEVILKWESVLTKEIYNIDILYSEDASYFESVKTQSLYGFHNIQEIIRQEKTGYYKISATNLNNDNIMTSNLIFIDNKNNVQTTLLPNPFQDVVQLQINTNKDLEVWVYDSQGKLVMNSKGKLEEVNRNLKRNSNTWVKGLYLFTILIDEQSSTQKVVKS